MPPASSRCCARSLTERQWQDFLERRELNIGYGIRGVGSYRINVFQQRGTPAAVVRYIPGDIPTLRFAQPAEPAVGAGHGHARPGAGRRCHRVGQVDHARVDDRSPQRATSSGHILTFEDPIEFMFRNKRSIVNQRQIGTDTDSLAIGLKNAMRQAPDCILIGEIRDIETMSAAIAYAQSGHLVLATLHANNANNALNRIVSFYPPENRRVMLADLAATLQAIVSQRLVRGVDGNRLPVGRVAAEHPPHRRTDRTGPAHRGQGCDGEEPRPRARRPSNRRCCRW